MTFEFGLLYDIRNPPDWGVPAVDLSAETLHHIQYRGDECGCWYEMAGDLGSDCVWLCHVESGLDRREDDRVARRSCQTPEVIIMQLQSLECAGATSLVYFATFPGLRPSATLPLVKMLADNVIPFINAEIS